MTLHLIKLSVGTESIADLADWQKKRAAERKKKGGSGDIMHITRMTPKRADELLNGGSMYWVIKGQIACRQNLLAIRPFTDGSGIGRCHLVLEPVVRAVQPRPYRPFQGWRYLEPKDAPPDLDGSAGFAAMPEGLRRELAELGLL